MEKYNLYITLTFTFKLHTLTKHYHLRTPPIHFDQNISLFKSVLDRKIQFINHINFNILTTYTY